MDSFHDEINGATTIQEPAERERVLIALKSLRELEQALRLWSPAEYIERVILVLADLKRREERTTEPPPPPPEEIPTEES